MTLPMRGHSWLHPALQMRHAAISGGTGVFSSEAIGQRTLLAILGGHVMRIEDQPEFADGRHDLAVQIHDDFLLGARFPDEVEDADSLNHSCEPNAGFQGQIFLVALRDISAGEEIRFDYAMVASNAGYQFKCYCGSDICRGLVTADDWKLPELRRRYAGYFSWYLEEKIRAEKI